jgi:hypothetical protein
MKSMIEKLQFWQQPEYHNYHVGAVTATLKEAESYIRELEAENKAFEYALADWEAAYRVLGENE